MSSPRTTYRVYCYDGATMTVDGHLIEVDSDAEAVAIAKRRGFGSKCEIWEGGRLVAELEVEHRLA